MFPFTGTYLSQDDGSSPPTNQFFPSFNHDDYQDLYQVIRPVPPSMNAPMPSPSPPPYSSEPSHGRDLSQELPEKAPPMGGRKRASRKDRHSKIVTAKGPRDRRMRLSIDVAKRFFDLQDALHFDKPSKTVQWLLDKSEHAIQSIADISRSSCNVGCGSGDAKTDSSCSECEMDSLKMSIMEGNNDDTTEAVLPAEIIMEGAQPSIKSSRPPTKAALHTTFMKELREKARARARVRTMEKKMMKQHEPPKCLLKSSSEWHELNPSNMGVEAPTLEVYGSEQPDVISTTATGKNNDVLMFDSVDNVGDGDAGGSDYFNSLCSIRTPLSSSANAWETFNNHHNF